jgi:hypothetical protein
MHSAVVMTPQKTTPTNTIVPGSRRYHGTSSYLKYLPFPDFCGGSFGGFEGGAPLAEMASTGAPSTAQRTISSGCSLPQ